MVSEFRARSIYRQSGRNVPMMAAVDEWRSPSTPDFAGIEVLLRNRRVSGSGPPLPSEFAPFDIQRGAFRQNRIPRDTLNPVREVHQGSRVRTHEGGATGVGLDLGVVLRRVSHTVSSVDLIVQLQRLV